MSVAEFAGVSTVIVSTVGAVQAIAAQLQVIGSIVTEIVCELPLFAPQEANLVSIVRVLETWASMCEPYC